jgi:hypothetical protein
MASPNTITLERDADSCNSQAARPVRLWLKLKRRKNKLQSYSASINGLPAVNVILPPWGVPQDEDGERDVARYIVEVVPTLDLSQLRGKNLACTCRPESAYCHADLLLRLANEEERGVSRPA